MLNKLMEEKCDLRAILQKSMQKFNDLEKKYNKCLLLLVKNLNLLIHAKETVDILLLLKWRDRRNIRNNIEFCKSLYICIYQQLMENIYIIFLWRY